MFPHELSHNNSSRNACFTGYRHVHVPCQDTLWLLIVHYPFDRALCHTPPTLHKAYPTTSSLSFSLDLARGVYARERRAAKPQVSAWSFSFLARFSRLTKREYRRIVTETKSRWLFADIHVAWATTCFSIITLMIIRENKSIDQFLTPKHQKNLAAILKTSSRQCYNHRAVIIAG